MNFIKKILSLLKISKKEISPNEGVEIKTADIAVAETDIPQKLN